MFYYVLLGIIVLFPIVRVWLANNKRRAKRAASNELRDYVRMVIKRDLGKDA